MKEKLVRDRIIEIARDREFRIAAPAEMPELLMRKLREEAAELLATEPGSPEEIEEAADVWSVAEALGRVRDDVDMARCAKDSRRGTFRGGLVLLNVDESEVEG